MNSLPISLVQVMQLGLGNQSWQQWVDNYLEKYDNVNIDGFTFDPLQIGYTWAQLIASTGATTLPAYVDPESPGYEASLREITGKTGNIPTMKKFYRLNRKIVQQQLQLLQQVGNAALTPQMQTAFMRLLDEGTDGLIKGYYNALTHQRMQIVSTGKFTIDATNNPRGLQGITLDFGVPTIDTSLSGTSLWWATSAHAKEGSAADPVMFIKNKVRDIRHTNHYYGPLHVEMPQTMYDDLLNHSAVLKYIGYHISYAANSDAAAQSIARMRTDAEKGAILSQICGVTIVPRDTYAYVDSVSGDDLVTTQIDNFCKTNIAFVPDGTIGTIQGVSPLTLGYEASQVAAYDEGRLILTQRTEPKTHSLYIDSEAAQICVPSQPQYIFIATVTGA